MKGGNYLGFLVVFLGCALDPVSRLHFLLSNTTVWYVDSDSQHEGFQKIRGEMFERISSLSHGANILKIQENIEFGDVWDAENALGSCAARNV